MVVSRGETDSLGRDSRGSGGNSSAGISCGLGEITLESKIGNNSNVFEDKGECRGELGRWAQGRACGGVRGLWQRQYRGSRHIESRIR